MIVKYQYFSSYRSKNINDRYITDVFFFFSSPPGKEVLKVRLLLKYDLGVRSGFGLKYVVEN